MSEQSLMASEGPHLSLTLGDFVHASDRKLRLFACGYWRMFWPRLDLSEPYGQQIANAIEVAEQYADGLAPGEALAPHRHLATGVASGRGFTAAVRAIGAVDCRTVWEFETPIRIPAQDWSESERRVAVRAARKTEEQMRQVVQGNIYISEH